MEKVPGYDCPHGHILYGKCLLCEREAQNEAPAIAPDDQLSLVTRQRDALLAVVKAVHYQDYSALPTYRVISALIESVESTPPLAAVPNPLNELLSAVEKAFVGLEELDASGDVGGWIFDEVELLRAAIAKAKGGAA